MVFPHRFSLAQKKAQCNLFCTALSKTVIFTGYSPAALAFLLPSMAMSRILDSTFGKALPVIAEML